MRFSNAERILYFLHHLNHFFSFSFFNLLNTISMKAWDNANDYLDNLSAFYLHKILIWSILVVRFMEFENVVWIIYAWDSCICNAFSYGHLLLKIIRWSFCFPLRNKILHSVFNSQIPFFGWFLLTIFIYLGLIASQKELIPISFLWVYYYF